MEEKKVDSGRPVNPRRRKPTPMQIFKERYLPLIIIAVALILIIVIIAGAITRSVQKKQAATDAALAAAAEEARLDQEAADITANAATLVETYDYDGAIALIDGFSGDLEDYPALTGLRAEYEAARDSMITWDDPSIIPHLSFQMLIADSARAFADEDYGSAFKKNFVTTMEFSNILEQLYANGYILVSHKDLITTQANENGELVYAANPLKLPAGKKPILLTQTNVSYDLYLVDGDDDGYADKDGSGFASRLVLDSAGNVTCEYIDASGNILTGAYDLIPILDAFVAEHPDFSYMGAKAVIALTGDEGLFGYRTGQSHKEFYGDAYYQQEVESAKVIAQALLDSGYELACYTYDNSPYGSLELNTIKSELALWEAEVTPIIGQVDTMVFAQKSDISNAMTYSGDKFQALQEAGFAYYFGFCFDGKPWSYIGSDYVRHGRLLVGGSTLEDNPSWFAGIFSAEAVLDKTIR